MSAANPNNQPPAQVSVNEAAERLASSNANEGDSYTRTGSDVEFKFSLFYHPFADVFLRELNRHGVMGVLAPDPLGTGADLILQGIANDIFAETYAPNEHFVVQPYPTEVIDFQGGGAFSDYNWEVFYHIPLLIAEEFRLNQRFEDARRWYHTIFDPRRWTAGTPEAVWRVKPLAATVDEAITDFATWSGTGPTDPQDVDKAQAFESLVAQWRERPFDPDLVSRLRPGTYQRIVVMRYIQNLLEWGDHLFRQYTLEAVNEATQLYMLASHVLGDKPVELGHTTQQQGQSFNDLASDLGSFSNALTGVEQILGKNRGGVKESRTQPPLPYLMPYFCTPPNDQLVALWDTVADRLWKIQHCRTIEGELRALVLFDPPIDPGLLVRAAAGGVSVSTVLDSLSAVLPPYRFSYMHQRAMWLVASVQRLGGALLAALEKKDAEALGLLRSGHELALLQQVRALKVEQIAEAKVAREGLERSKEAARLRHAYYEGLLRGGNLPGERSQLQMLVLARKSQLAADSMSLLAADLKQVPQFQSGTEGGLPTITTEFGGEQLAGYASLIGESFRSQAGFYSSIAGSQAIRAGHERRAQEWKQQRAQAEIELETLDKQLEAAALRIAITEKDLANHDKQTDNARQADQFLRSKFTNDQLYSWTVGQLSSLYFQSYQLAFDTAKQAEQCYAHEIGVAPLSVGFIRYGAWDSLKKGLLAGERLQADLERMEAAFIKKDARELEITKNVSLSDLDPVALIALREQGACAFSIPEVWFDLDYPGHYLRRLQTVTVSVPSVSGPIAGLTAELELMGNKLRYAPTAVDYANPDVENEIRPVTGTTTVIATSTGTDDGGLFSIDLRDPRYLPFERLGAISEWELRLTGTDAGTRPTFDWQAIADVVLTLRYTAVREDTLKTPAIAAIPGALANLASESDLGAGLKRAFRARVDFPNAWKAFLNPAEAADASLVLPITKKQFPFPFRDEVQVKGVELLLRVTDLDPGGGPAITEIELSVEVEMGEQSESVTIDGDPGKYGLPHGTTSDDPLWSGEEPDTLTVTLGRTAFDSCILNFTIEDLIVVLHYEA